MQTNYQKIIQELEFLLRSYSNEKRATVNPFRLENKKLEQSDYRFVPDDLDVQETLLEHVGMLPVLAVYFHAQIQEPVDLGKALSILAVHDIGELIHGDKNVFIKQAQDEVEETTAALGLLDERHHDLYLEFEAQETNEAKFAKSIDKIAPDILDVLTDRRVTTERLQYFAKLESGDIALAIEAKKSPHMQWSTFFRSFHADLITNLKEILPPKDSK